MVETREIELSAGTVNVGDTGGDGPVLVLLHGLLVDGSLWDDVVARARAWARCVVPELPLGSHKTPMRAGADLSPPGVAALVAELLERLDLRGAVLVGNDTGGAVAQMVAAWHPERVGSLVLTPCDAFGNFLPPVFKPLQLLARVPGGPAAFLQPTRITALHNTPLVYGLLARTKLPHTRTRAWLAPALGSAEIRRDLSTFLRGVSSRQTEAAAERLRDFEKPALVAWNEKDRVFPREHGERLADLLPEGRLETIRDSGVFVPVDQPAALATALEAFARQTAAA
jgi:pimeloyl-ACP methyl ester carboxylesterase